VLPISRPADRDGRQLRDADGNLDAMLQAESAAMSLAEKYGLGVGESIKPRPDHDPWKDRFWGRREPYAEAFEGVSYEPGNPKQVVVVTGALSPPSFDPDAPADNAPAGGWPLLLVLPSGGSMTRTEETDESALDVFASRDVAARFGTHVLTVAFPRMRNGWAVDSAAVKHESFIVRVLVPYLRKTYGAGPISVLGVGSGGFGAVSLLLRHPAVFFRAAAFDSPLMREGFMDHDTKLNDPGQVASFGRDLDHFRNYHSLYHMVIDPRVMAMLGGPHPAVLRAAQTPLFPEDGDDYTGEDEEGEEGEETDEADDAEAAAQAEAGVEEEEEQEYDEDGEPLYDNPYYDFFQRYLATRPAGPGPLSPENWAEEEDESEPEITELEARGDPVLAELRRVRLQRAAQREKDEAAARAFLETRESENQELDAIRAVAQEAIPRIAIIPCGELAQGQKANYHSTMMFAQALAAFGVPHVCGRIPEPPLLRSWISADSWLPAVLAFIATGAGEPYSPATHTAPSDVVRMTKMRAMEGPPSYAAQVFSPVLLRRDRLELDAELWDPVRPKGEAAVQRAEDLHRSVTASRVAFLWMKLQAMITIPEPEKEGLTEDEYVMRNGKKVPRVRTEEDFGVGQYPWIRHGRGRYLKPFQPRKPRTVEEQLRYTRKRRGASRSTFLKTRKAKLMLRFRKFTHAMTTEQLCELGHQVVEAICKVTETNAAIAARQGDTEFMERATLAAEAELTFLGDPAEVARIVEQSKKEGRPARIIALEEMATRARARQQEMGLADRLDIDAPQSWEDNELAAQVSREVLGDPETVKRISQQAEREGRLPHEVALEQIAARTREAQRRLDELDQEGPPADWLADEELGEEDDLEDEEEMSEEDLAEMAEIEAMELREMMQNGDPLLADLEKEFGVRRRGTKTGEWSDSDASDMDGLLGDDEELGEEEEEEDGDFDFDDTTTGEDDDDEPEDEEEEEEDEPPPPPPPPKRPPRRR
jgi:hypothetical protein